MPTGFEEQQEEHHSWGRGERGMTEGSKEGEATGAGRRARWQWPGRPPDLECSSARDELPCSVSSRGVAWAD